MNLTLTLTQDQVTAWAANEPAKPTPEQVTACKGALASTVPPPATPQPPKAPAGSYPLGTVGGFVNLRATTLTGEQNGRQAHVAADGAQRYLGNPGAAGVAILPIVVDETTKYVEFAEYAGAGTMHMVYASKLMGEMTPATLISAGVSGQFKPKWAPGEVWYVMVTNYACDARHVPTKALPGGQMLVRVN